MVFLVWPTWAEPPPPGDHGVLFAPLDRCIRVSLGDDAALDAFAAALPQAIKAAG